MFRILSVGFPLLVATASVFLTPASAGRNPASGIRINFDPCFQQITVSASQTRPAALLAELSAQLNIPIRFESTRTELRDYRLAGDLSEIITGILGHTNYAARNEFDPGCGSPRVTQLWIFSDSIAALPEEVAEIRFDQSKHISSVTEIPEPIIAEKPADKPGMHRSEQPPEVRRAMKEAEKGKRNGRGSNRNNTP